MKSTVEATGISTLLMEDISSLTFKSCREVIEERGYIFDCGKSYTGKFDLTAYKRDIALNEVQLQYEQRLLGARMLIAAVMIIEGENPCAP